MSLVKPVKLCDDDDIFDTYKEFDVLDDYVAARGFAFEDNPNIIIEKDGDGELGFFDLVTTSFQKFRTLGTSQDLRAADIVNTAPLTLTTSFQDIPLNFERVKDSIFTHGSNSAEVTVTQTGRYTVFYSLGTQGTSGGTRSQSEGQLLLNGVLVPNSNSEIYNRNSSQGGGHAARKFVLDLTSGDILKIQVRRQSGGNTQQTIAGASGLIILESKGLKGEKGDTGTGSSIDIQEDGVLVPNGPFTTINFNGGLTAVDEGGGVVNVSNTGLVSDYYEQLGVVSTGSTGWVSAYSVTLSSLPAAGEYKVDFSCQYTNSDEGKDAGTRVLINGVEQDDWRDGVSVDDEYNSRGASYHVDLTTSSTLEVQIGQADEGGTVRVRNIRFSLIRLGDS